MATNHQQQADQVRLQPQPRHLEILLNRPERKNAINQAMYTALTQALNDAAGQPEIRSVLLAGAGDCFTAGNDLADFANAADLEQADNPIVVFMQTLMAFPKPVVVAVQGAAVGIGTTLLLHSDLIYASPDARFSMPFVKLGLCPEFASSCLLPLIAGRARANEWLLLGREFDAQEALKAGLVNAVEPDPIAAARQVCTELAKLPPGAVRTSKSLLRRQLGESVDRAIQEEIRAFTKALGSPEFAEAASAFFEKRSPDFSRFD